MPQPSIGTYGRGAISSGAAGSRSGGRPPSLRQGLGRGGRATVGIALDADRGHFRLPRVAGCTSHDPLYDPVPTSAWPQLSGVEILTASSFPGSPCCEPAYGAYTASLRFTGSATLMSVGREIAGQGWRVWRCHKHGAMPFLHFVQRPFVGNLDRDVPPGRTLTQSWRSVALTAPTTTSRITTDIASRSAKCAQVTGPNRT